MCTGPFPTSATLGLGNGVPLGSRTPRGQYTFKPYPSAISLWLPSPPLQDRNIWHSCHCPPAVDLILPTHSLGCPKGVIGSIPPVFNKSGDGGRTTGEGGSGKSFARHCFRHSLMQQHLLSAPRQLGPVGSLTAVMCGGWRRTVSFPA